MLYSEHIANLASIACAISCQGIEVYENGKPSDLHIKSYVPDDCVVYRATMQSAYGEQTIEMYSSGHIDSNNSEAIDFIPNMYRSMVQIIKHGHQWFEGTSDRDVMAKLSHLCNQKVTYADWYDVLIYLGYDLPDCEWIYDY
jgi:hypothetical protein